MDQGLVSDLVSVSVLDEVSVQAVSQVEGVMEEDPYASRHSPELGYRRRLLAQESEAVGVAWASEGVAPGRFHEWTFQCVSIAL